MLGESQPKPEFLGHVATAAVLEESVSLSTPTTAAVACLRFLRVKNEAGFQKHLKRLPPSTRLHPEGGKEKCF